MKIMLSLSVVRNIKKNQLVEIDQVKSNLYLYPTEVKSRQTKVLFIVLDTHGNLGWVSADKFLSILQVNLVKQQHGPLRKRPQND